ncbi:hypothetical protein CT676_35920 [Bradyrhizobium sp. MOS001]|uniref:hypothetical protein n=1 Tax=unclassified Bradyrhizobium TaxID=2631580 RepID=UPI0010752D12|nr:hypothetical protein [Bradyrhizobium sp. MOS001]TFW56248.1 hypothetical protein CT676_35920 [Bradyrhizobium sp. MOS001]
MKLTVERAFADSEVAARKLVELAANIEAVQDGRIYIERINAPFMFELKGSGTEFGAGLRYAVAQGWLELHESGTYVRLKSTGEDLLAKD